MRSQYFDRDGRFLSGSEDYAAAQGAAADCLWFTDDPDEDEQICDNSRPSCYNCLYRRWSATGFVCLKRRPITPN